MSENQYPLERQEQVVLFRECMVDAALITKDFSHALQVAGAFYAYRVKILSDRIIAHDMLGIVDTEELNELLEGKS